MLRILLTFLLLVSCSLVEAQITITDADLPNVGDDLLYKQASINGVQTSATGANQFWNYSNLAGNGDVNETFIQVSNTDVVYFFVFGTPFSPNMATVAKKENFPIAVPSQVGITIEDPYAFYREQTNHFSQVGLGAKIQGFPVPIIYNPPDRIYKFPLQFDNRDTADFAYNIDIPSLGYYGRKGTRINHVDGWGNITLPGGANYNCLRLKSLVNAVDSVQLDTLSLGFNLPIPQEVKYKWLAPGHAWPVLEITASKIFNFEQITRVIYFQADISSVDQINEQSLNIYPNPATDMISIKLNHAFKPKSVQIFDISGRLLLTTNIAANNSIDLSQIQNYKGMLLVQFSDGEKTLSKKIIKL